MLDDLDRRLLRALQDEPSLTVPELAERARLTASRTSRRLDRMKQEGVFRGQRATIGWAALGYGVEVSLRVTLDKTQRNAFDEFIAAAREVPEVTEIQTFLGKVDVRLGVLARDMGHYQRIYRGQILNLPHIADVEALMHVATIKSSRAVPL